MRTLLLLQCAAGALAFYSGWHGAPLVGGGRETARSVRGRRATSMYGQWTKKQREAGRDRYVGERSQA
jgi:hypothetical protein